jgi:Putative Ig domain/Fibronectin type III domain
MNGKQRSMMLGRLSGLMVAAWLLGGCSGSSSAVTTNSGQPAVSSPAGARLVISGTPANTVTAGAMYSFQPTVTGNTSTVTFSITGIPAWATFDEKTGALLGTPATGDVGTTGTITITADEGGISASLTPFLIEVTAAAPSSPPAGSGTATLSWAAPTHNIDGSVITDLAGYHIYYGTDQSSPSQTVAVAGPASTTYVVQGLAPGTYYFTVVAYNSSGEDSADSNVAVKTI